MYFSAVIVLFIFTSTKAEEHNDHFTAFAPSTVNFNEIFTNSLTLPEDPPLTTKDEEFHLNLPSQFVEFRQPKVETTTTPTPPSPRYILNSSYLKKENVTEEPVENSTPLSSTSKPEDSLVNVIPIKKKNYQRGVLDLLFPASRVRGFKSVFDTFRRILSHTFRKR